MTKKNSRQNINIKVNLSLCFFLFRLPAT